MVSGQAMFGGYGAMSGRSHGCVQALSVLFQSLAWVVFGPMSGRLPQSIQQFCVFGVCGACLLIWFNGCSVSVPPPAEQNYVCDFNSVFVSPPATSIVLEFGVRCVFCAHPPFK